MHQNHAVFESAIRGRTKVRLTFYSKEGKSQVTRVCAPLDFAVSTSAEDKSKRYQLWDDAGGGNVLSLVTSQVRRIEATNESFDPAEIVTWSRFRWAIKRDWGKLSLRRPDPAAAEPLSWVSTSGPAR